MNLVTVKRRNWVEVKELQQNMDEYDMLRMKGEDFGAVLHQGLSLFLFGPVML